MKKILFVCMIFSIALAACGSPTAAPAPAAPANTAAPAQPTDTSAPAAAAPSDTPAPAAATDTPAPAAPTDTPAPVVAATNTSAPAVGGAVFTNITHSADAFALRCSPSEITFSVTSINPAITSVVLFYRVENKDSANGVGTWVGGPTMVSDKKGGYTLTFSALNITPDSRVAHGWFDYQFVGLNKRGDVVGRSDKISQQIGFTLDCP